MPAPSPAVPDTSFPELIRRVRAGDEAAAASLVRSYEPEIRRAIRVRLTDPRLCRLLDSMDVCQSVFGNFFARVAAGQFDLRSPRDLLGLLLTMARNKLIDQARRQQARPRYEPGPEALDAVPQVGDSPSQVIAGQDLLRKVRQGLSPAERRLADWRAEDREWDEIGRITGESAEALRNRLARAIDRVARHLGLEEVCHE